MPAPTMMTLGPLASAREAYCAATRSTAAARAITTEDFILISSLFSLSLNRDEESKRRDYGGR